MKITRPDHPEVGRELKVSELRERQIVWVQKEGRSAVITLWVKRISDDFVWLYFGVKKINLLLTRKEDGQVTDEDGLPMVIYEYLGEEEPPTGLLYTFSPMETLFTWKKIP